jgi:primosomal protein N' (replication factor Y)
MSGYAEVVFNIPVNRTFTYSIPSELACETGCRVIASLGNKKRTGLVVSRSDERPRESYAIRSIERIIDKSSVVDSELLELGRWLSQTYLCSLGEALHAMIPGGRVESDYEDTIADETQKPTRVFSLVPEQHLAVKTILGGPGETYYVSGVTGSGKTEVFLQIAKHIHNAGRGVIYLVPEISLVHQVVEVFEEELDSAIAVLHSGLTPSQRLKNWRRLIKGEARVVIGARSAVFAPVRRLGLIVVDEEHEGTYKSGFTPRYHARQVASFRCHRNQATLIMGSATPSIDAYYRMETGKIKALHLSERLSGGRLPKIEIVDMKKERSMLSRAMIQGIREVKSEGRQTILFLNRRGFAYLFYCRSCGYEMQCKNCCVSLTYHRDRQRMICHYCGYQTNPVEVCPECGSLDISYSGFGTERIEEELQTILPDLSVKRVDTDSVSRKNQLRDILLAFRRGEIDVLIGTQMVAKGLNFPGVKLVGIVSADVGMQMPDFRALEKAFSLIVQVSGRAGRTTTDGRVIVQTFKPANNVIRRAAKGEQSEFYREELQTRKLLKFPPYQRLIRIVFRGKSRRRVEEASESFHSVLDTRGIETLGPVECPFSVISGNTRYHLIVRGPRFKRVHDVVSAALSDFKVPRGVYLEVDIDPVSLL